MMATNDAALHRFLARPSPVDQFPASQLWVNNPDVLPLIEDVAADPRLDENGRDFYADANAKSTALLPLRVGESWVGLFVLIWPGEQKQFSEDDARLYRSISSQLAVVVNGLLLLQQTEARARREQVLREITGRVNAAVDAESILRAAAREIGQTLDLEAFVYLTESQGNGHDATS
jgi:GAF domain-containing protein